MDIISDKFLSVTLNGGAQDTYIQLFTGDTGYPYDNNRQFYGDTDMLDHNTLGFISIIISGTTYWIQTWTGNLTTNCCSNLIGVENISDASEFISAGHALISVNNTELRWIRIFTKV
jgi:hypothetical protein